jgi:hypothetical protein
MACRLKSVRPRRWLSPGRVNSAAIMTEIAGEPILLMLYTRDRQRHDR